MEIESKAAEGEIRDIITSRRRKLALAYTVYARTRDPTLNCRPYGKAVVRGTGVNKDDMILISVDDHIVEPPEMFKNHLPKRYIDDAPQVGA